MAPELLVDLHVKYIQDLDKVRGTLDLSAACISETTHPCVNLPQKRDELAYYLTEHLRMNGIYWGLTALALMDRQDALDRQEMIDWVMSCWDEDAGAASLTDVNVTLQH